MDGLAFLEALWKQKTFYLAKSLIHSTNDIIFCRFFSRMHFNLYIMMVTNIARKYSNLSASVSASVVKIHDIHHVDIVFMSSSAVII